MRYLIFAIFLSAIFTGANAQHTERRHEADYVEKWCGDAGGQSEFRLRDRTRVDCLLDAHAIEFDWSYKWAECVGQAAFYGEMTERKSVCVLIKYRTNTTQQFYRFTRRAKTAARRADVIVVCLDTAGKEIACGASGRRAKITE